MSDYKIVKLKDEEMDKIRGGSSENTPTMFAGFELAASVLAAPSAFACAIARIATSKKAQKARQYSATSTEERCNKLIRKLDIAVAVLTGITVAGLTLYVLTSSKT